MRLMLVMFVHAGWQPLVPHALSRTKAITDEGASFIKQNSFRQRHRSRYCTNEDDSLLYVQFIFAISCNVIMMMCSNDVGTLGSPRRVHAMRTYFCGFVLLCLLVKYHSIYLHDVCFCLLSLLCLIGLCWDGLGCMHIWGNQAVLLLVWATNHTTGWHTTV